MILEDKKPFFLITIDTEGDNPWSKSTSITTENANYLPRFQSLCEQFGFKPTYLTNYEMAMSPRFQDFGRDIIKRNVGEIGMHLHAWNSPPAYSLTTNDAEYHPYLIEYPENIILEKVKFMTQLLEDTFKVKMVSHRAGRWAFNETYAQVLIGNGYSVDCSVTPHISWAKHLGDPKKKGGSNFTNFPDNDYFLNPNHIKERGEGSLLEVPFTVLNNDKTTLKRIFRRMVGITTKTADFFDRYIPKTSWFRPDGKNLEEMKKILEWGIEEKRNYIEFMLHSSELMPGGSPTFPDGASIEKLYKDLQTLFKIARQSYSGCSMKEYHQLKINSSRH